MNSCSFPEAWSVHVSQVPAACGLSVTTASAPISTLQSWSLGLPSFYEQGFGEPNYILNRPFTAIYFQDAFHLRPGLTLNAGLRYEVDSQPGVLNTYHLDLAPRFSFAWDPFNDGKTVVRGKLMGSSTGRSMRRFPPS